MLIFLGTFFLATICNMLSDKYVNKKKSYVFWTLISVVLICGLAGVRDIGVGTDTAGYLQQDFDRINRMNFTYVAMLSMHRGTDILFWSYNYILVKLLKDINWVMFFLELPIVLIFQYIAFKNKKEKGTAIWFTMLIFYFFVYVETYNTMRQSIAVAITLLAMRRVYKKKWVSYVILMVLAVGFHSTAIIALIIPIADIILKSKKYRTISILTLTAASIILVSQYQVILLFFVNRGILASHYLSYGSDYVRQSLNISTAMIVLLMFMLGMYFMCWRAIERSDEKSHLLLYLVFLDNICYLLNAVATSLYRMSLYFGTYPMVIFIPATVNGFKDKRMARVLWIIFMIVFFYVKLVLMGWSGVYPYTSQILGI